MKIVFRILPAFVGVMFAGAVLAGEWLPVGGPERLGFDRGRLDRITQAMQAHVEGGRISGAVMAVARNGRLVYRDVAGFADIETQMPMQEDTVFRIYSMTKPITSTAIMILVEEGKIRLTDPVSKFIPAIAGMKVYVNGEGDDMELDQQDPAMTVRHLLTHTSGIPYQGGPTPAHRLYEGLSPGDIRSLQSFVEELTTKPLVFQPGSRWMYGMSTDVLGYVVEAASGMPFEDFVATRITTPLGMDETDFVLRSDQRERFATAYEMTGSGLEPSDDLGANNYDNPGRMPSGGGGMVSTVADYLRFSQMLLNGGVLDRVRILSPRSVDLMRRNHLTDDQRFAEGLGFGLGFAVTEDTGVLGTMLSEGSYSWGGAADTHFWIDPVKQLIGVVMTQRFAQPNDVRDDMRTMTYQALLD